MKAARLSELVGPCEPREMMAQPRHSTKACVSPVMMSERRSPSRAINRAAGIGPAIPANPLMIARAAATGTPNPRSSPRSVTMGASA